MTPDPDLRPLRRDAELNRRRILDAARGLIAEHGLEASFEQIARVAGVGAATVHRRFPTRADLVLALFDEEVGQIADRVRSGLTDTDPWSAFCAVVTWVIDLQAGDRGLIDALAGTGLGAEGLAQGRRRLDPLLEELVSRAQAGGALRRDVVPDDVRRLVSALAAIGGRGPDVGRERLVLLALDGMSTTRRASPLPSA